MAKASFDDMQDVTSMRVLGSQERKKDGFTRLDIRLNASRCSASVDMPAGTLRILKNADGAWFSVDDDFLRSTAGSSPQAEKFARTYAGKWSVIKEKSPVLGFCDFDKMLGAVALDRQDTDDTIEVGEVVQVGDADAVPVTGQNGKERVTVWVAVDAPHRVLKLGPAKDTGRRDELYFEEFGVDVEAESPAKKDLVVIPGVAF